MTHRLFRPVGMTVVALLAALVFATATLAADPASTKLTVSFSASTSPDIPNYLVAQLTLADGSAVADQQIVFLRTALPGSTAMVELGRAVTDMGGYARLPLVPRSDQATVTARFDGGPTFAPASFVTDISFPAETVVHAVHAPNGGAVDPRLRPLASLMPAVLAGVVVLVWLTILTTTVTTIWTVRSSGTTRLAVRSSSMRNEGREHGND